MSIRRPFLALGVLGAACIGLAATASAQGKVLSLKKPYAYFKAVPGQAPNHYRDDGPINGPHKVHTTGLGTYGLGNLTDGAVSTTAGGGPGTTHLALWGMCTCVPATVCCGTAPPADIVIDLGSVQIISDFVIGTVVGAGSNNNAPDDVAISFSITGTVYTQPQRFDLEKLYGPLANGHHDLKVKIGSVTPGRFVKFAFDGGSMTEPDTTDPNEKYMLDEITIIGPGTTCTASSSSYGTGLAGKNGIPTLTVSAPPKFLSNINVLASNSSGVAASGLILLGVRQSTVSFLGGTLLVDPLMQVGVPVPAAGVILPVTVPGPPCVIPLCIQFLQLDAAATSGVSMSPGLRLDLGN